MTTPDQPCTADLLSIIYDLVEALSFDAENCDFGPAYGMGIAQQEQALKRGRGILRRTKFKKLTPPEPKTRKRRQHDWRDDLPIF